MQELAMPTLKRLVSSRSRAFARLLRVEPRTAAGVGEGVYLLSLPAGVIKVSANSGPKCVIEVRPGFSATLNMEETPFGIFWGDYGNNAGLDEVNIYVYEQSRVKTVYSFPQGSIRHIHNIIYDKVRNGFWILTGDNEPDAGIWFADVEFKCVKPIVTGQQRYRAVVGFPTEKGLIYATDAVEEDNFIYHLDITMGNPEIEPISCINGSSIYGTELKDYFIFSTVVEPHEGRGLMNLFSYELGAGIKSRDAHIIAVNKNSLDAKVIMTFKKDWLPMKLFQYGAVQFPKGQNTSNHLICNVVACKRFDGKSVELDLE